MSHKDTLLANLKHAARGGANTKIGGGIFTPDELRRAVDQIESQRPIGVYRGWINQPSTLQPLHNLHGKRCIVVPDTNGMVTIWFADGPTRSMRVDPNCVSAD